MSAQGGGTRWRLAFLGFYGQAEWPAPHPIPYLSSLSFDLAERSFAPVPFAAESLDWKELGPTAAPFCNEQKDLSVHLGLSASSIDGGTAGSPAQRFLIRILPSAAGGIQHSGRSQHDAKKARCGERQATWRCHVLTSALHSPPPCFL